MPPRLPTLDLSSAARHSWGQRGKLLLIALPALGLPIVIRTAVVRGVATATEASTIGIVYTMVVGIIIYRQFDWRRVYPILVESASLSGAILLVVGAATGMDVADGGDAVGRDRLTPLPSVALAERAGHSIYGLLRSEIITLRLRPGEKLSESELATRFGTSRAPVREALIRLVGDGLIDVRPQRGSFVSPISLRAMERARFVREALEVAIIRRAAQQGLSDAAHSQLAAAIEAQCNARTDTERFIALDDLFHRGLAEGAGLGNVWDVIEREKAQFDRLRFLSLPSSTPVDVLIEQHRAILRAVLERRPAVAERALRSHLQEVLRITDALASRHRDLIVGDT